LYQTATAPSIVAPRVASDITVLENTRREYQVLNGIAKKIRDVE